MTQTQDGDYFLTVEVGKDIEHSFKSPEQLAQWISGEREYWNWTRSLNEKPYSLTDDAVSPWRERLADASGALAVVQNSSLAIGERNSSLNRLMSLLGDYMREDFISSSPRATFVQYIRESEGDYIAFAALNHALGGSHKAGNSRTRKLLRRAYGLIDSFDMKLEKELPASVATSIKKLISSHTSTISKEIGKAEAALGSLLTTHRSIKEGFTQLRESLTKQSEAHSTHLQQAADAAIERIESTRKAYQEHMHLGASVDYWNKKADKHEASAKDIKRSLIRFSLFAGLGLAIVLGFLGFFGIGVALHQDASPTAPLLFIGIGVVATTGVMWVGRVLVRLFLSEHHLAIDARERAVMTQTFLALTNEGKIEPQDRALVLAPMFRPTADGIVKDDAAPDATIAGHLSRLLGR